MTKNKYAYLEGTVFPEYLKEELPFTVPNILGQRYCDNKEVIGALEDRGGYDRGLYRPVFAIAVLKDVAKSWIDKQEKEFKENPIKYGSAFKHNINRLSDYAIFLFDGNHRKEQLRMVDADRKVFPSAMLYIVESVEDGNTLFNDFNDRTLTKVSPESLLINDYLAGDETAIQLVKKLEDVGLSITDRKDSFVLPRQYKDDKSIPSITANPWKLLTDSDWHPDFNCVKKAIKVFKDVLAKSKSLASKNEEAFEKGQELSRFEINSWIIHGLATLIRFRPNLLEKPQPRQAVIDTIAECLDYADGKQNVMMGNLRNSSRLTSKILPAGTDGLNSCQVWALVFGNAISEHGPKHGVRVAVLQDATKLTSLWDDIQAEIDRKRKVKEERRLLKLAS